jgi:hypothetical protein
VVHRVAKALGNGRVPRTKFAPQSDVALRYYQCDVQLGEESVRWVCRRWERGGGSQDSSRSPLVVGRRSGTGRGNHQDT